MTVSASLVAALNFVVLQLDDVIIGQTINSRAVGAVGLVAPFVTLTVFASTLVADGTVSCILCEIGKLHKHRASVYFTNGLVLSVLAGLLCAVIGIAAKDLFIGGVSSDSLVYSYAETYFQLYLIAALLLPLNTFLLQIVYIEGNERLFILSILGSIAGDIFFSVVLAQRLGISGVVLGTIFGTVIGGAILIPHFFSDRDALGLDFKTSPKKLGNILRNGLTAGSSQACAFLLTLLLNRYFLAHFSVFRLPILAVVENIIECSALFCGLGKATAPFLALYHGENNLPRLHDLKVFSVLTSVLYSTVFTAAVILLAPEISKLFGIPQSMLFLSSRSVRIAAVGLVPTAFLILLSDYHSTVGSLLYSSVASVLRGLLIPLLLLVPLTRLFGMTGMWLTLGLAPYLTLILLYLPLRFGSVSLRDLFNMHNEPDPNVFFFELDITPEHITGLQQKLDALLTDYGICRRTRNNVTLMVEEIYMLVLEANPGKSLSGECTVSVGDEILLVIKDNGVIFDVTDCDMPVTSFRRFMLGCIMEKQDDRMNLTTLCCNRNAFRLPVVCDVADAPVTN